MEKINLRIYDNNLVNQGIWSVQFVAETEFGTREFGDLLFVFDFLNKENKVISVEKYNLKNLGGCHANLKKYFFIEYLFKEPVESIKIKEIVENKKLQNGSFVNIKLPLKIINFNTLKLPILKI